MMGVDYILCTDLLPQLQSFVAGGPAGPQQVQLDFRIVKSFQNRLIVRMGAT
jgi:hypothetical protein